MPGTKLDCIGIALSSNPAFHTQYRHMHCYFVLLLLSSVTVSFSKLPDILARDMEHQEFSCEGLVCRALGRIFGAINMGVFTSVSTDYSLHTSKTTANLVAGLASSVGAPFFMLGFFNEESDYNLELDWKLAYEKARHGALSIGAASSGAGVAFSRIIEFKDVDGDKKYSPADAVVSAYPLIGRKWNKMVVNEAKNKEITSLTYNFSTTNGLASFEYTMNSESHPLSPYGAKIAIEVTGYDYKETSGTALAVEAVFISTEANATAMASVEFGNSNMSYTWEQHSILFDQISAQVHASSAFIAEVSILDNGKFIYPFDCHNYR